MAAKENAPAQKKSNDPYLASLNWETSRVHQMEKSERRAWVVAMVAVFLCLILGLGISFLLPLKENTPYVIRVDNATGIPDIVTALDSKGVGYDEVMDKYWLAQYVKARETYEWWTLNKDYQSVSLFSSPTEWVNYSALFNGDNALDKKYGKDVMVIATVNSVVPNGNGIATVRFSKTMKRRDDTTQGTVKRWVATIGYEYKNPSAMKDEDRQVNPFAFQVLSYRTDPETGVTAHE